MNGVLVINKEQGMTSRDVVNKLNHILKTKQIGHTGTLDPIATGVLVCPIGYYTKLSDDLTFSYKEYIATFKLGIKTDTYDITGNILSTSNKKISKEELMLAIKHFTGVYEQTVPIYSAVKVNGKKMYEYARENKNISLPKRKVDIKTIELLNYEDNIVKIKCLVSKGTYIRSLIDDIGIYLGCFASMSNLIRTKQGIFSIENAYSLENVERGNFQLLTFEDVLDLEIIEAKDDLLKKVMNGVKLKMNTSKDYLLFKKDEDLIALYKKDENVYKMHIKIFK